MRDRIAEAALYERIHPELPILKSIRRDRVLQLSMVYEPERRDVP